jgi:hypothetical protein
MYVLRVTGVVPHEGTPPAKDDELVEAEFGVAVVLPGLLQAGKTSRPPMSTAVVRVVR